MSRRLVVLFVLLLAVTFVPASQVVSADSGLKVIDIDSCISDDTQPRCRVDFASDQGEITVWTTMYGLKNEEVRVKYPSVLDGILGQGTFDSASPFLVHEGLEDVVVDSSEVSAKLVGHLGPNTARGELGFRLKVLRPVTNLAWSQVVVDGNGFRNESSVVFSTMPHWAYQLSNPVMRDLTVKASEGTARVYGLTLSGLTYDERVLIVDGDGQVVVEDLPVGNYTLWVEDFDGDVSASVEEDTSQKLVVCFGEVEPTPTLTSTPTATATPTPEPTATSTPTATATMPTVVWQRVSTEWQNVYPEKCGEGPYTILVELGIESMESMEEKPILFWRQDGQWYGIEMNLHGDESWSLQIGPFQEVGIVHLMVFAGEEAVGLRPAVISPCGITPTATVMPIATPTAATPVRQLWLPLALR